MIALLLFIGSGFVEVPPPDPEPEPDPTAPAMADPPTVFNITATSAMITWPDPDDGGTPITRRDLQHRVEGATSWITTSNITLPRMLSSLTPGTSYQVRGRCLNAIGSAPWSVHATFTTLAE